ncbi:MAG: sn-glycerol-1-phosphate dehydrogenase [Spirochaetes bacterium]|nr:sn-glycerol-1-phosphate dehydrogenase [Spirochaetota bacterium]
MKNMTAQQAFDTVIRSKTEDLMGISFDCICGETHGVPIKYLSMGSGAVERAGAVLDDFGFGGRGVAVCDRRIESTVVREVMSVLSAGGLDLAIHPVGDGATLIKPEVSGSEIIAGEIKGKADYLVAVGSGVICDLVKYAATSLGIPCALIGTAPSMNGYTSSMAALSEEGIKKTIMIDPPRCIFGDTAIMRDAPVEMVRAGLGDIISKSICNADWKLSQIVKKTYFCPLPFRITDKSEPEYLEAAEAIGGRTEEGIRVLTDGIMRSGLSMTVIGTSMPSSGAEHFISHYWDLMALKEGGKKLLHGTQVGVSTLLVLDLYEWLKGFRIKRVSMEKLESDYPTREEIETFLEGKFGVYSEGIKAQYLPKYLPWKEKKAELQRIVDTWDSIFGELQPYIRPKHTAARALKKSGAPVTCEDLGKTRNEALEALIYARYIRGRYTILDLLADFGVLEQAARSILG